MNDEHKRNAKIIAEAIAQLEKDPEGMALAFANIYLHSKPKRETPEKKKHSYPKHGTEESGESTADKETNE